MNAMTESPTSDSPTHILELNFDCLWEIFEYFDILELCAVADVCQRFRETARAVYQYSKFKNSLSLSELYCTDEYASEILRRSSRVLRNFGAQTKSLHVNGICYDFHNFSHTERHAHQLEFIKMLGQHCKGTLNELTLSGFIMTDALADHIHPTLRNLRKLKIYNCQFDGFKLGMLTNSAPKLRELKFECYLSNKKLLFDDWHYNTRSVESISFKNMNMMKIDIDRMLSLNPQLKKITFDCCRFLDDSIFESIAMNGSQIETIRFQTELETHMENIRYLSRLRNLKVLRLGGFKGHFKRIVHELAIGRVPIEHLHLRLSWCDYHHNATHLVNEIVTLTSLKTLRLEDCENLTVDHIMKICNSLPNLGELHLKYSYYNKYVLDLSGHHLWQLIEKAEKLNVVNFSGFQLEHETHIDGNIFMKMVDMIQLRGEKTCVELELEVENIVADIPTEMASTYNDLLKLKISE